MVCDYWYRICNYSNGLLISEKLETKNILMDEKNYENLVLYLTNYVSSKSKKILSLYYHRVMEKIKLHEEKTL